ncbi:MAG: MlaE family lipid ABC transporter permease subunit [Cyanobacteriota bacterium]|nr:MlaE family lipid ABC transporter permease subunit [Cyanobacteriota bacterium]
MSKSAAISNFTKWSRRSLAAIFLAGQTVVHLARGKINRRNVIEQMAIVGPQSLSINTLTAAFVGMVFTIQVAREFLNFGVGNAVGGVLAIALTRELAPVLTAVVVAGRVGSAFAAELGTMQVTEQIDALYILKTDPIDYLVIPRILACGVMVPILTLFSLLVGMTGGLAVATSLYGISPTMFLESARNFLQVWDLINSAIKGGIFGSSIAVIGCSWGLTTTGGAKGVGESTTTAVVTALMAIFISNFFLSWVMFQGLGDASL